MKSLTPFADPKEGFVAGPRDLKNSLQSVKLSATLGEMTGSVLGFSKVKRVNSSDITNGRCPGDMGFNNVGMLRCSSEEEAIAPSRHD